MDRILSFAQIQNISGEIRNLRKGFVTNFYWDDRKHPGWIEEGRFYYFQRKACCLLLHPNDGFDNLYYIATDMDAVAETVRTFSFDRIAVVDVISKKEGGEDTSALRTVGFAPYKVLNRMGHIGLLADDAWEMSGRISSPSENDISLIYQTLQKEFDPLCEQLPTMRELYGYVRRKGLLVAKEKNELCGFLIFEILGSTTWFLRYWYTSTEYRNQNIGSALMRTALVLGEKTKRQQLWVLSDNQNAISRYEHYGFQKEPIYDYVMIKNK